LSINRDEGTVSPKAEPTKRRVSAANLLHRSQDAYRGGIWHAGFQFARRHVFLS